MHLLLMTLLAADPAPDAALLERLAARAKQVEAFTAAARLELDVLGEELDADGVVKKSTRTTLDLARDGARLERKLLRHVEDGEDLTEQKRKELEAPPKKSDDAAVQSPFHPTQQAKYRFVMLAPSADGHARVGFQPAGEKTPELMMGDATLDAATGDLLTLSMRPAKTPPLVDSLSLEASFDALTPAGRAMSKLTVKGVAGVLFFKKRFRVVTTLGNYRPLK